jgi:serine/threonine protein kinase/CRP-like cAMP-binding protein
LSLIFFLIDFSTSASSGKIQPDGPLNAKETSKPSEFVELRGLIGKGAFGVIYHGSFKDPKDDSRRQCAVKQLPYAEDDESFPDIVREIQTMRKLANAPFVVQLFGAYIVSDFDKRQLWIVMQYADCGSLLDFMKIEGRPLSEAGIRHAVFCSLHALKAMHAAGLIHRDLKSANLLWCSDSRVLVADMGETAWIEDDGTASGTKGTPYFMSPECALGTQYDAKTDIWSLAITVIELAEQKPPRHAEHPMRVMFALATDEHEKPTFEQPGKVSPQLVAMVDSMLHSDPSKRPSAAELLEHAYFAGLDAAAIEIDSGADQGNELRRDARAFSVKRLGKTMTASSSSFKSYGGGGGSGGSGGGGGGVLSESSSTSTLGGDDDDELRGELAAMRDAVQIRDPDSGETCDEFTTNLLKWKAEAVNTDSVLKLTSKLRHTATKAASALFGSNAASDKAAFRRNFELMTCILTLACKVSSKAFGLVTGDRWLGNTFFEKCFTGKDATDWFYENLRLPVREDAVQLVLHLDVNGMIVRLTPPLADNLAAIDSESQLFRFHYERLKQWSQVYQYEPPKLDDAEQAAEILHFQKKKDLNERDWRLLLAGANAVRFEQNAYLFHEGDENESLYRIKSGQCRVEKKLPTGVDGQKEYKVVAKLGVDVMFGEMSVLSRDARTSAAIVADSADVEVHVIDVDFISDLFATEPGLKQRFFYNICLKLVGMIKNLSNSKPTDKPRLETSASAHTSSSGSGIGGGGGGGGGNPLATSSDTAATGGAAPAAGDGALVENRDAAYRTTFGLPDGEVLIDQYECSVRQIVKQHGTLFVSANYICFRSKVFGKVTKIVVPIADVTDASRSDATSLVISTRTKKKAHKFTELQRAVAAAELCAKLAARAHRPDVDVRANMSRRGSPSVAALKGATDASSSDGGPETLALSPRSLAGAASANATAAAAAAASAASAAAANEADASPLTSDDWDLLLSGAKCETLARDTVIIAQDEWATRIYQIAKGSCRAEKDGKRLGAMQSGEVFGEISFLEGVKTTASVIADQDNTEIYIIEGGMLKVLFVRQPALAGRFFNYLATMLSTRLKEREKK